MSNIKKIPYKRPHVTSFTGNHDVGHHTIPHQPKDWAFKSPSEGRTGRKTAVKKIKMRSAMMPPLAIIAKILSSPYQTKFYHGLVELHMEDLFNYLRRLHRLPSDKLQDISYNDEKSIIEIELSTDL